MFPSAVELFETGQMRMDPELSYAARSIIEGRLIAFDDMGKSELYEQGSPVVRSMVDEFGIRSVLFVPLVKDGAGIGNITLFRREISPFDPSEIALVQTFAAQALIAIENVRRFREVTERLEREKASGDVLDIISRSRDDDLPVFRVITEAVSRLCRAPLAYICLLNVDRTHVTVPAQIGARREFAERLARFTEPVEKDWLLAVKAPLERKVIRIDDLADDDLYRDGNEYRVNMVDEEGMRSVLVVPLVSGDTGVGCIFLYRREVAPFSDAEVALVETFAAQAVIAIENVRQFRELQTRLEREAATREVLEVISRSRADDGPVFDVILRNAGRLCDAPISWLVLVNEDRTNFVMAGFHGETVRSIRVGEAFPLDFPFLISKSIHEARIIHVADIRETELYLAGDPTLVRLVEEEGLRTRLHVPLISGDTVVGCIILSRREVLPFNDDQIALVETFARQAAIAIENVRQFKALEALNAELGDRVEAQVGEIERMGRLKRFLPSAVADTVVREGSEKMLSSHRVMLGVLFCDIRGFTAFCETAEPEETIEVLQTYHEEMGKLINAHGAGVDHRMGDGVMVLFNDPLPCEDPAGAAVRLAIAMRERMAALGAKWKRLGYRLGFGVGVSLGYATVGMVGFEGRFDYTASGTAINLAARLCDEAEDGEILLSPRARIAVEDDFPSLSAGEVTLKGIREPVEVFRLVERAAG